MILSVFPLALILAPIILLFLYVLQRIYIPSARLFQQLEGELKRTLQALFSESHIGISHIRAFQWQPIYQTRSMLLLDRARTSSIGNHYHRQWLCSMIQIAVGVVAAAFVSLILCLGLERETTIQVAIGLLIPVLHCFDELSQNLMRGLAMLETSLGGIARVKAFEDKTPVEVDEKLTNTQKEELTNWPRKGHVIIERMSAKYE